MESAHLKNTTTLKSTIDIKSTLNISTILNIISSVFQISLEVLYVLKPKSLDYL